MPHSIRHAYRDPTGTSVLGPGDMFPQYTSGRMRAVDLIIKKRDGGTLDRREIAFFISGVVSGEIPSYQASALLMAIVLSGLSADETRWLTEAMASSGTRVKLDAVLIDDYSRLSLAPNVHRLRAPRNGFVTGLNAHLIGQASVALGAGRDRAEDEIDPAVGITIAAKPGTEVAAGDVILELHYRATARLEAALPLAARAIELGESSPLTRPTIVAHVA